SQFPRAGEVVGVDVGLRDRRDPHSVSLRQVEVLANVASRGDHDRLSCGLAADEVAGLGEIVVVKAFEQHGISSLRVRIPPHSDIYPRGYATVVRSPGESTR